MSARIDAERERPAMRPVASGVNVTSCRSPWGCPDEARSEGRERATSFRRYDRACARRDASLAPPSPRARPRGTERRAAV